MALLPWNISRLRTIASTMKATTRERHTTQEEPLPAWGPAFEDKIQHCFSLVCFPLYLWPHKAALLWSLVQRPRPLWVLPGWDIEKWKQLKTLTTYHKATDQVGGFWNFSLLFNNYVLNLSCWGSKSNKVPYNGNLPCHLAVYPSGYQPKNPNKHLETLIEILYTETWRRYQLILYSQSHSCFVLSCLNSGDFVHFDLGILFLKNLILKALKEKSTSSINTSQQQWPSSPENVHVWTDSFTETTWFQVSTL